MFVAFEYLSSKRNFNTKYVEKMIFLFTETNYCVREKIESAKRAEV